MPRSKLIYLPVLITCFVGFHPEDSQAEELGCVTVRSHLTLKDMDSVRMRYKGCDYRGDEDFSTAQIMIPKEKVDYEVLAKNGSKIEFRAEDGTGRNGGHLLLGPIEVRGNMVIECSGKGADLRCQ